MLSHIILIHNFIVRLLVIVDQTYRGLALMYIHTNTHTHTYKYTCAQTYKHTRTCTHTHKRTNVHTHIQFGSLTSSVSSKRQWVILRRETARGGQSRLELYRSEEQTVDGRASREVFLDAIKLVEHAEKKKAFVLHMQEETLLFLCSSHAEMEDWIGDVRRFRRAGSLNGEFPDNSMGQELYEGR